MFGMFGDSSTNSGVLYRPQFKCIGGIPHPRLRGVAQYEEWNGIRHSLCDSRLRDRIETQNLCRGVTY